MELPHGWEPLGPLGRLKFQRALRRQMGSGHVLERIPVKAIAKESHGDSVAYMLDDGRIAAVHLTWTKETSADWPSTAFYDSLQDLLDAYAAPDNAPVTCAECGSNWSANEARSDCGICGGYALFRPCPVCGGTCSATWERAILDSQDAGEPIFIGHCRKTDD